MTKSLNIPAVRLSEAIGRENVRTVAGDFGLGSDLAEGPSLALGVSEATLITMVGAYAGILNGGSAVTPYGLLELRLIEDDAPVMGAGGGIGERVIRQSAAEQLVYMMHNVVTEGTGQRAALDGWQVAGKTGTTQAARDAWFIGFTADYVTGVWMGYDDNRPLTAVTGGGPICPRAVKTVMWLIRKEAQSIICCAACLGRPKGNRLTGTSLFHEDRK